MADGTKVQINDLADFGKKTAGMGVSSGGSSDTDTTVTKFTKGLGGAVGGIAKGQIAGSGLGTNESQTFNDWYSQAVSPSATQCVQDTPRQLMALGGGAVVMAGNYAEGDISQRKAMDNVLDMFSMDPSKGLDADLDKQGASDKYHTTTKPLPPVTTTQDPVKNGPETPGERAARQATEHHNKYGKDETWPKPPKEPKTKILAPGPIGEPPPSTGPMV
jgi:hypothetical protein